jgi:subtilisin family serine protease
LKYRLAGILLLALVVAVGPAGTARSAEPVAAGSRDVSVIPGEFIVEASPEEVAEAGLTVVGEVGFGWTLVTEPALDTGPEGDGAEQIASVTGFEVEPNYRYQLADEPLFPQQWSLENTGQSGGTPDADIDIQAAWQITTGEPGVVIAVLDTGAAFAHPDLSSSIWVNTDEVAGNGIDDDVNGYIDDVRGWDMLGDDNDPSDTHGHGTFVSTTAAAPINGLGMAGVAPQSVVMPIKVCDSGGCPNSAIIGGMAYAIDNGADVINLSFGGYGSPSNPPTAMKSAISEAVSAGIVVVAAAGNDGNDNDGALAFYPAGYDVDGLIAVAASNNQDALAAFSNFGATSVDLAAPGQNVLGGSLPNSWGFGSGTSFSSPKVAGVAALIMAVRPDLSAQQVAGVINGTVDLLPGLSGKVASGGRLNAGSALDLVTAPVAVASASPSNGILPYTVQLSGGDSFDPHGTIVTWSWKLPDGSVVKAVNTNWSPSKPGTYQATLTVVDDDGKADAAVVVFSASLRPGGTFVDDNEHYAEGAIEAIAAEGITQGCNPPANDRFCPDGNVTRGQMAAFLVRALGLPATTEDFFDDDQGSLFEGAINRLAAAGITKGCNPPTNSRYCPDDPVTRGQMAVFLARAFGLVDGVGADVFVDDDGSVFENSIDKIATVRITTGCNPPTSDRFCPDSPVKRGEMAVFLSRALNLTPFYPPPAD